MEENNNINLAQMQTEPETLTNTAYTPAFLKRYIGRLVRIEFLIGTTYLEDRNVQINQNSPEILTNNIYTPAFLREQMGKLMRVEFLIGTNNLTDRIGILEDVGASYILLRSVESNNLVYCDIYSIKFVTITDNSSITGSGIPAVWSNY